MATTSNLSSVIHYYTEKTKSGTVDFREFCSFMKKYAEHHLEEQSDLVKYLGNPTSTITSELQQLSEKHLVSLVTTNKKQTIVYIPFYSKVLLNKYNEIAKNTTIPFPIVDDLPKYFPINAIEKKNIGLYISSMVDKESIKSPLLYILEFDTELPSIVIPACVPIKIFLEIAQQKVQKLLRKDEYHDYFLKKLRGSNPTKEISVKNFYSKFIDAPYTKAFSFDGDDEYYIWNQTLYYIRQDFEKTTDKTLEDINILQSVKILETQSTCLKEKNQQEQKKNDALKELDIALNKIPYFYSMQQILKFQDSNGRLLYGRYSGDDLKEFLQKRTTEGNETELPPLLIFKVASGTRYYINKKNVPQVVVRLCNEAHVSIAKELEEEWYNDLLNFDKVPEMSNISVFEDKLKKLVEVKSPVLHALLNATFMTLLAIEYTPTENTNFHLFSNGHILPYSELLMLYNNKIFAHAKRRLPFYYNIPLLNWFVYFFSGRKAKPKKNKKNNNVKIIDSSEREQPQGTTSKVSKQELFAAKAKELAAEFVPEGSSIDRELDFLVKQWNKMISKEAYNNLVEDVNSLIRDYTRRVVKTLTVATFTKERVEGLAKTLVNTPNMKKISEQEPLREYVSLYILRLISN